MKLKKVYKRGAVCCLFMILLALLCAGCGKKPEEDNVFTINACKTRYVPRSILDQVREEYPDMEIRVEDVYKRQIHILLKVNGDVGHKQAFLLSGGEKLE